MREEQALRVAREQHAAILQIQDTYAPKRAARRPRRIQKRGDPRGGVCRAKRQRQPQQE